MTQHVIAVIGLASVTLVVDVSILTPQQNSVDLALQDVSVVLIKSIADAVLLVSGQMNIFANHAHLDVLFAGLQLIATLVLLDGILINAAVALLQSFLASLVIRSA